jgi:prepilin-type N-terminal cleavage/methylation domain-containing protein
MRSISNTKAFTIIEMLVAILILCILSALIALTASGVQANNRNGDRQKDIDNLRTHLEGYYAGTDKYPTLGNLNSSAWRAKNLPNLKAGSLDDPRWNQDTLACTQSGEPVLASLPSASCYSYQVTANDGSVCDNQRLPCAHYTLTALLEGGGKYVKSSLN